MSFYPTALTTMPSPTATPSKDGLVRLSAGQKWNDDGAITVTAYHVQCVAGSAKITKTNGQTVTIFAGGHDAVEGINANGMKVEALAGGDVIVKFNYLVL